MLEYSRVCVCLCVHSKQHIRRVQVVCVYVYISLPVLLSRKQSYFFLALTLLQTQFIPS